MTAAKPTTATLLRVAGHIHAWPAGFADGALPEHDWLVIHARPRHDKLLTAELGRLKLPGLLIYERRVCRHAGHGKREILVPLLGTYAFVNATDHARDAIYATGRIISILTVRQESLFVRDLADLVALVRRVDGPLLVNPDLVTGVRVTVTEGAFAGLCGVIARRQGHDRLVVNLPLLGSSVSVELPAATTVKAVAGEPSP